MLIERNKISPFLQNSGFGLAYWMILTLKGFKDQLWCAWKRKPTINKPHKQTYAYERFSLYGRCTCLCSRIERVHFFSLIELGITSYILFITSYFSSPKNSRYNDQNISNLSLDPGWPKWLTLLPQDTRYQPTILLYTLSHLVMISIDFCY